MHTHQLSEYRLLTRAQTSDDLNVIGSDLRRYSGHARNLQRSTLWAMAFPATRTGRVLLVVRTALGVSTLVAPRIAGKAFLLDPDDNPQLPALSRMWGIRNLSLAAGMYAASGANRSQWWRLQPAVDALDFLAIAVEWRRGSVPHPAAALMAGTALGATALGALSVAGESAQAG